MPKPLRWLSVIGGCLLSTAALLPSSALAQVSISPLVIEAETDRGQGQGVIEVSNVGEETFRARVYASAFSYNESGLVELESSPFDLTPYLLFSPNDLVVQPGQTRRIRLSARLLPSMPTGEYRAVIFTESLSALEQETAAGQVRVIPRIGALFFVRMGETEVDIVAESARVLADRGQIELLLHNHGTASDRPVVTWQLLRQGQTVHSGMTPKTTVLAGENRRVLIDYQPAETPLPAGTYQLSGSIEGDETTSEFAIDIAIPE